MSTDELRAFYAPDPLMKWARRAFHASIVYKDWLFIDGGEAAIGEEPLRASSTPLPFQLLPVNCSFSIPLNESWTSLTLRLNAISKPPMTRYNFQSLFYDTKRQRINTFGGELSLLTTDEPDLAIWSFRPNGNGSGTWARNGTSNDPPFGQGITRNFGAASTNHNGQYYSLGGYTSPHTSPQTVNTQGFIPTPGIVNYNSTTSAWSNNTDINGPSPLGTLEWATLEAVPLGPNGLLAVIGGDTSDLNTYVPAQNRRSMTTISLYDPVTKRWYQQATTGTPPSQRSRFCTVGVRDPTPVKGASKTSLGTYEIFMSGGWGGIVGASAKQYDETWILTLPAFHWTLASSPRTAPRIGHTCHAVGTGRRQLLSIGGQDVSQMDPWGTPDTANPQGIGVFDMTALNWTQEYDVKAKPYSRADIIEKVYRESGDGMPAKWTDPALEALVLRNITTPLDATNNTIPAPSSMRSKSGNKTALAAGVTTGLLVLLIAMASLFFFYIRHRQRKTARADAAAMEARLRDYKRSRYLQQQELAGDFPPAQELPVEEAIIGGWKHPLPYTYSNSGGWYGRAELGGDFGAAEKDGMTSDQVRSISLSEGGSSRTTYVGSPGTSSTKDLFPSSSSSSSSSTPDEKAHALRAVVPDHHLPSGAIHPALRKGSSPITTSSSSSSSTSSSPITDGARRHADVVVSPQSPAAAAIAAAPIARKPLASRSIDRHSPSPSLSSSSSSHPSSNSSSTDVLTRDGFARGNNDNNDEVAGGKGDRDSPVSSMGSMRSGAGALR